MINLNKITFNTISEAESMFYNVLNSLRFEPEVAFKPVAYKKKSVFCLCHEGIIASANRSVLLHLSGLNAVLQVEQFSTSVTNLVTGLPQRK